MYEHNWPHEEVFHARVLLYEHNWPHEEVYQVRVLLYEHNRPHEDVYHDKGFCCRMGFTRLGLLVLASILVTVVAGGGGKRQPSKAFSI